MESIKAGWSGRLVRNGTMKNVFTCHSCSIPCIITKEKLSDDAPVNCVDRQKRKKEEKERNSLVLEY